eukprot:8914111-Lingulodinium_polyedra.AAC.1
MFAQHGVVEVVSVVSAEVRGECARGWMLTVPTLGLEQDARRVDAVNLDHVRNAWPRGGGGAAARGLFDGR